MCICFIRLRFCHGRLSLLATTNSSVWMTSGVCFTWLLLLHSHNSLAGPSFSTTLIRNTRPFSSMPRCSAWTLAAMCPRATTSRLCFLMPGAARQRSLCPLHKMCVQQHSALLLRAPTFVPLVLESRKRVAAGLECTHVELCYPECCVQDTDGSRQTMPRNAPVEV